MRIRIAPKIATVILRPTHRFNDFNDLTYEQEHGVTLPLPIPGKKTGNQQEKHFFMCTRSKCLKRLYV